MKGAANWARKRKDQRKIESPRRPRSSSRKKKCRGLERQGAPSRFGDVKAKDDSCAL
jgi:hypothetical protein